MSLSEPDPKNGTFGIFWTGSYGVVWVYTPAMGTFILGVLIAAILLFLGVLMFGEDY